MGYGIGYQGSKSRIIKKLAESFLPKENFYDLFGGGFAVNVSYLNSSPLYKVFCYDAVRQNQKLVKHKALVEQLKGI